MLNRVVSVFLTVVLLMGMSVSVMAVDDFNGSDGESLKIDSYAYAITSDSNYWLDYTVQERVDMLRIPEDDLAEMTDEELVQAIASYPYLVDIYLYGDSVEDGIEVARNYFSALDELLNRTTASTALVDYGIDLANRYYSTYSAARGNNSRGLFIANALLDIILTQNHDVEVVTVINGSLDGRLCAISTRSGTASAIPKVESHTSAWHAAQDQEIIDTYYVTLVSPGTCIYNCHSYAWYDQSTSNPYWINDPTPYMYNSVYTRVYSGGLGMPSHTANIRSGDIIFYGDYTDSETSSTWHSAILVSNTMTGEPISNQMCVSKWGTLGVFRHKMGNVPYGYDRAHISAWRAG